jgi:hypothetical protein
LVSIIIWEQLFFIANYLIYEYIIPKPYITIINYKEQIIISPYEILKDIYLRDAISSFHGSKNPEEVERTKAIISHIDPKSLYLDYFGFYNSEECKGNDLIKRLNIYIFPKDINKNLETEILLAHYDVANPNSDNVLDNTASVSILLALAKRLKNISTRRNIVLVFTDAEEICSYTDSGSARLAKLILKGCFGKVSQTINLELTAHGNRYWIDGRGKLKNNNKFIHLIAPYSDTSVLKYHGIDSVVIGSLYEDEIAECLKYGSCETWNSCHKNTDSIDKGNANDMENFCDMLFDFCVNE